MKRKSGIELLDKTSGAGQPAAKGDDVIFNMRLYLNQGDEVHINEAQISTAIADNYTREVDGFRFLDRRITLGRRQVVAGIEYGLMGMSAGGYRKLKISPHLAYRDQGIPGLIPANAVLVVELWLREVKRQKGLSSRHDR